MRFGIREIIFLLVLLAVPAASAWYLFMPRNAQIQKTKLDNDAKLAKIERLQELTNRIDDIGLAIERGREKIEEMEQKLPPRQDVEGILEQVWSLARASELNVRSVKSQDPIKSANYLELPLKVVMEGQFDGFYQFLLAVESLQRITRVHELELKRVPPSSDGTQDPGLMESTFTLSIYFEP